MDRNSISWVGDMYQKFESLCVEYQKLESLCVEVEETMYEDTVKYVEDHMRTVGATVKKFYSDIMDDFLPQPSPPKPKERNLLTVVHRNRHDSECMSISGSSSCNASLTENSPEDLSHGEVEKEFSEHLLGVSNVSSKSASDDVVSHIEEGGVGIEEMTEASGSVNVVNGSETKAPSASTCADTEISATNDEHNSASACMQLFAANKETSNALVACETKGDDSDKQEVLHTKQLDELKLAESCVLVEKIENSFILLPAAHEQKSYKKKIRNVFYPRKWSKSKPDQKQLVVWLEEQKGTALVPTSPNYAGTKELQSFESVEADWELL